MSTDGETITDRPGRRVTLLLDADELAVTEFFYGPGERGAKLHVHHHHADAFLVVEGELTFALRDGSLPGTAGTLVIFPPGVVHGFDNDGAANARFFNFHMPSSGFGDYLRGRNSDFDQHDPPADGGGDPASVVVARLSGQVAAMTGETDAPIVLHAGEGEIVGTSVVKAARPELSLIEFEIRPGGGVQPHLHKGHSDSFYVLEGEVQFHVGDEVVHGSVGTYVLAPPGVVHFFRNVGDKPVKVLNLHTPGGFVEYRRELLALQAEGVEPDAAFFERHDLFDV